MLPRCGKPRPQQDQAKSLVEARYETDLLERLAQTLGKGGFFGPSVEQARRLGATTFKGSTDPSEVLSWLVGIEKVLKEGMQCLNENKARIARFLLKDDAHKW